MFERLARRIWRYPAGPMELFAWPLTLLSWFYARAARRRVDAYLNGEREREALPVPVISIGNLSVGGTGKTPTTIWLAQQLLDRGNTVGVLTRGYGGSNEGKAAIMVSDGSGPVVGAEVAGDEAVLLAQQLPNVPVAVCARRAEAGRLLLENHPVDVILLDDGFQHVQLQRDADLVLVDGDRPVENGFTLPRGPLREPPRALGRADLVMARVGSTGMLPGNRTVLAHYTRARLVTVTTTVTGITDMDGNPVTGRSGMRVVGACGIARPERFRRSLEKLGLTVVDFVPFADHAAFQSGDVANLVRRAAGADAVVVTAKDAVKLVPIWPETTPLWVVHIGLERVGDDSGAGGRDWIDLLMETAGRRFTDRRHDNAKNHSPA